MLQPSPPHSPGIENKGKVLGELQNLSTGGSGIGKLINSVKENLEPIQSTSPPSSSSSKETEVTGERPLSEFAASFYESKPVTDAFLEEMRTSKGKKGGMPSLPVPKKNSANKALQRKRRKMFRLRRSLKRLEPGGGRIAEATVQDDSVMILSPVPGPSTSGAGRSRSTVTGFMSPPNVCRESRTSTKKVEPSPKRMKLSPKSSDSGNETIDLVCSDSEDETKTVLEGCKKEESVSSGNFTITGDLDVDVITLSDDEPNDVPQSDQNQDVEVIAIKECAPGTSTVNRRRLSFRKRNSLSYNSVKLAVDRVRKRSSTSNINQMQSPSLAHRQRQNRQNQKAKRKFNNDVSSSVRTPPLRPLRRRKIPQRRTVFPVYVLDNDLGPANPNFEHARPQWQRPGPGVGASWNSGRGAVANPFNHRHPRPVPTSQDIMRQNWQNIYRVRVVSPPDPVVPSQPNFITVPTTEGSGNPSAGSLRPIVIDGSNVAMSHKGHRSGFSCRGIQICVDFFKRRGHDVIAVVPQFRRRQTESLDPEVLDALENQGLIRFTPSREVGGHRIASYDDRFIIQYAHVKGAVIVSNDNYRDIYNQHPEWRETIELRVLQFTWMDEEFLQFPVDPLGRNGPPLDTFLRF